MGREKWVRGSLFGNQFGLVCAGSERVLYTGEKTSFYTQEKPRILDRFYTEDFASPLVPKVFMFGERGGRERGGGWRSR